MDKAIAVLSREWLFKTPIKLREFAVMSKRNDSRLWFRPMTFDGW